VDPQGDELLAPHNCWCAGIHLFRDIGILGDLAAGKEQTFGTLTAHHLAWIGGKLHYGHLDFLNATFMSMHGGVSKV